MGDAQIYIRNAEFAVDSAELGLRAYQNIYNRALTDLEETRARFLTDKSPQPLSPSELVNQAQRRWDAWYDEDMRHFSAVWPGLDPGETPEHYIVREDVPLLLAELNRLLIEADDDSA